MSHPHHAFDVQPKTVTLCVSDNGRWTHVSVTASLWDGAGAELREKFLGIARDRYSQTFGDTGSPAVSVVRDDARRPVAEVTHGDQ